MVLNTKELLELIQKTEKVIIDLGCGPNKIKGSIGIDILPLDGVDYVSNLEEGLGFLPNQCIDEFHSSHFLEHLENLELILSEMYRVLKPEGIIRLKVPHFSNPYFYSDYTHKRFFGLYSFDYFSFGKTGYKREVPHYSNIQFIISERRLFFKSPHFFIINAIKKYLFNRLFNLNKYMQSLYEDSFSKLIPCYELHFILIKPDNNKIINN